jgi:serine/threonine protein kinase
MWAREYGPGDLIAGAYRVRRVFGGAGASGMGVVYLVDEREAPKPLVLKACQMGDPVLIERFAREAEVWVGLGGHPNITRALWVRNLDDRLFVAAEYVDGSETGRGSLADIVGSDVSPSQILGWIVQFCSGLSHALARGLVAHRDVKPANLLLSQAGLLKIADFGLGKVSPGALASADSPTAATGVAGTIPYMSPEQILGSPLDHRCDIYAFGIVLYQICSRGGYPYRIIDPSRPDSYFRAHLRGQVQVLSSPFWQLIDKCLAKSPSGRWQSPEELANASVDLASRLGLSCPPFAGPEKRDLDELYARAQSFASLGKPGEALSAIQQYIHEAPNAYWAWTEKGRILLCLDRYGEAEQATRRSLALYVDNSHAWNNLGVILRHQGNLVESRKAFERSLVCDPLNAGAMMNAAQTLCELRCFEAAADLLCTAIRLVPTKPALQFNAGNNVPLMLQASALEPAERVLRALISANERNGQAWHNLGVLLASKRRFNEALQCAETAVDSDPDNAASRMFLARMCIDANLFVAAVTNLDYLIRRGKEVASAVCLKAQVLVAMGRYDDGVALLESHLSNQLEDDAAWFVLCHITERQGDIRKALQAAEACYNILARRGRDANRQNVEDAQAKVAELRARLRR